MKKVYASTIFGMLLEQQNLLAKYSHDKLAIKEIVADIKSIESVITLLSVKGILKYDAKSDEILLEVQKQKKALEELSINAWINSLKKQ